MIKANPQRLRQQLLALAELAKTPEGICRLAYSAAFWRSNDYIAERMREAGMTVRAGPVGNVVGTYPGKREGRIVLGSHIDSVVNGGMFDGCLGVIAGIEAVRRLHECGVTPSHTIDVAAFAEEEGLVIAGLVGSRAYCGLPPTAVMETRMGDFGFTRQDFLDARAAGPLDFSLELHIEQGGVLERRGLDVGVVTAIIALKRYTVTFCGEANHAGTTPMDLRDDALVKAARFIQRVQEVVLETDREMVGTVGRLEVRPNAVNTVPGRVTLTLELRAQEEASIRRAYDALTAEFADASFVPTMRQEAYPMDPAVRGAIHSACEALGLSVLDMGSGAGHDSMSLAQVTRAGMIFVPSVGGVSHSPEERTEWRDVENGANVLLQTLQILDGQSAAGAERSGIA